MHDIDLTRATRLCAKRFNLASIGERHGMSVVIAEERPDSPDAVALIGELDDHLGALYAVESRHALQRSRSCSRDGVNFFVARDGGRPAGCGGVLLVGRE